MLRTGRVRCRCERSVLSPSSTFLLLSALFLTSSNAQPSSPSVAGKRSSPALSSISFSAHTPSALGQFSTTGAAAQSALSPRDENPDGQSGAQGQRDGLLNYYFLLLAILIIIIGVAYWVFHRRRKNKVARVRNSGQNALARDLDGWAPRSRWIYGGWRGVMGGNARHEEGLDEHGEAPPPYQPRGTHSSTTHGESAECIYQNPRDHESFHHDGSTTDRRPSASTVSIPLRTLSRDGLERRPPDYEEALENTGSGPRATTADSRPDVESAAGLEPPPRAMTSNNENHPHADIH
ncbi:hypothetical protein L228DRAFT_271565 [Xylona heveae TC161]|uniref:Uncharacterized protein n=1 Tax=Xylona heveae (strain CBS 132557 / TC161) TaxID=1328760 RepID=A0A164ZCF2_XYLHT|nr:hypothetical protein L228DRAFT_271565 [Xylona heveae TC161]KZF18931.1 hypothetical protein L228DRAFT_271565 [Xylona heveae TC161]